MTNPKDHTPRGFYGWIVSTARKVPWVRGMGTRGARNAPQQSLGHAMRTNKFHNI